MSERPITATQKARFHWLDNLRTVMILLVVLYHVGGVYEAAGLWGSFWIVDDPATITWVGIVGIVFDVFVIATVFFVSGYLAPASLRGKSGATFCGVKARRLLLPWLIAVITLIPLYKVIFLYSRGMPQQHWTTYFHITNPNSQNWLWFLPLLFLFNLIYLAFDRAWGRLALLSIRWAEVGAFVVALVTSYGIGGLAGFRSWTLTPLLDFENERVLVYLMSFFLGAACNAQDVFAIKSRRKTLYTLVGALAWIPLTGHIFVRLIPFFTASFEVTPLYRLLWWVSFHAGVVCMVYQMVETFWRYLDRTGPVWRELGRNAYGVYIVHVIVLGVFGTLLLGVGIPAVAKYLLLVLLTLVVSNLLVSGYHALARSVARRT